MSLKEYYSTPGWQRRRIAKIRADGRFLDGSGGKILHCERCERLTLTKQCHVHHLTYETVGEERFGDLEILCRHCHAVEHGWESLEDYDGEAAREMRRVERRKKFFSAAALADGFWVPASVAVMVRKLPAGEWGKHIVQKRTHVVGNPHRIDGGFVIGEHMGYLVKVCETLVFLSNPSQLS